MLEVVPTGQRSPVTTRSGRNGLDLEKFTSSVHHLLVKFGEMVMKVRDTLRLLRLGKLWLRIPVVALLNNACSMCVLCVWTARWTARWCAFDTVQTDVYWPLVTPTAASGSVIVCFVFVIPLGVPPRPSFALCCRSVCLAYCYESLSEEVDSLETRSLTGSIV